MLHAGPRTCILTGFQAGGTQAAMRGDGVISLTLPPLPFLPKALVSLPRPTRASLPMLPTQVYDVPVQSHILPAGKVSLTWPLLGPPGHHTQLGPGVAQGVMFQPHGAGLLGAP